MKVDYVDLSSSWLEIEDVALPSLLETLRSGHYVLGSKGNEFEKKIAEYFEVEHCVAVNSGTDALVLAMYGLGIERGDQVIVPANSFIASAAAVAHLGAIPVLVDCNSDQSICLDSIKRAVTEKTRAVMPVHLSGRMCEMEAIKEFAEERNLLVIEDAAQAFGTHRNGLKAGTVGDVGCYSCHPLKNLNGCGDAGFFITNNDEVADKARSYRNHGLVDRNFCAVFGGVSRLDELQAAILLSRLNNVDSVIQRRRINAERYKQGLRGVASIYFPEEEPGHFSTFHTFVIQVDHRDELVQHLKQNDISVSIHYPTPISEQKAMIRFQAYQTDHCSEVIKQANKILSLPINEHLTADQIEYVIFKIKDFYGSG